MCCSCVLQVERSRSLREYFDPARAAKARDTPISWFYARMPCVSPYGSRWRMPLS